MRERFHSMSLERFYLKPEAKDVLSQARVAELHRYAIKSCQGETLIEAPLDSYGIKGDRLAMVVDKNNVFMTQREQPRMAQIKATFLGQDHIEVSAPKIDTLRINLTHQGDIFNARIWEDQVDVVRQEEASEWFTKFLGVECQLVAKAVDFDRPANPKFTRGGKGKLNFQDSQNLHMISVETIMDFNRRAKLNKSYPISIDRTRPNIVLSGSGIPHAEDIMQEFFIGNVIFRGGGFTWRCPITTKDQKTGRGGKEPLKTLATYRCQLRPDGSDVRLLFGRYFMHQYEEGMTLSVGDTVRVLKVEEPPVVISSNDYLEIRDSGYDPDLMFGIAGISLDELPKTSSKY